MKLIRSAHRLHVVPPTQTVVIEHVSPGFTLLLFFTHGGNTWKGKCLDLFGIGYVEDEIVTGIRFCRKSLKE